MSNAQNAVRSVFVYVMLVPLALLLGYLLATAGIGSYSDITSLAPILLVFGLLALPLLLKWHLPLLLLSLNTSAVLFLFPGSPPLWFAMAAISLTLALGQRALDREMRFIKAPSVVWPVLCLAGVVGLIGYFTGGFGVRIFGGDQYGGKRYLYVFAAVAAFFAIIAKPVPTNQALLYVGLYFLGALANTFSNLIPLMPREFYWLALILPVSSNDMGFVGSQGNFQSIGRFLGMTTGGCYLFYYLLARYGIGDMLTARKWWRFLLLICVWVMSMWGGFRTALLLTGIAFLFVFYYEGLFRTRYAAIFSAVLVIASIGLVPLANKLPLPIQRTLTLLPLDLNPIARYEAEGSSEWRLQMWALLLPEVPKYLFSPKGMGINGAELELTGDLVARGQARSEQVAMLAGDYHNGPLSILIPFGIYGAVVWLWFLAASIRALLLNYRYGSEPLRKINTLLLACFLSQLVVFSAVVGAFFSELIIFLGLVGLSISINNGICKSAIKPVVIEQDELEPRLAAMEPALVARRG